MSSRAVFPMTNDLCVEGCFPAGCRRHVAPATRAPAHLPADLESRAIAMLDDDQLWATFYRWRTVLRGETAARSLREKLGVEEYVAAIYREIPA